MLINKELGQNTEKNFCLRHLAKLLIKAFRIELEKVAAQQNRNAAQQLRVYAVAVKDAVASHATYTQLLAQPYNGASLSL